MMNLPLDTINILYKIAEDREAERQRQEEEAKKKGEQPGIGQRDMELLQDELEGV